MPETGLGEFAEYGELPLGALQRILGIRSYASIAVLLVEHYDSFKGQHGCDKVCVDGKSGCAVQVAQFKHRRVSRLFAG